MEPSKLPMRGKQDRNTSEGLSHTNSYKGKAGVEFQRNPQSRSLTKWERIQEANEKLDKTIDETILKWNENIERTGLYELKKLKPPPKKSTETGPERIALFKTENECHRFLTPSEINSEYLRLCGKKASVKGISHQNKERENCKSTNGSVTDESYAFLQETRPGEYRLSEGHWSEKRQIISETKDLLDSHSLKLRKPNKKSGTAQKVHSFEETYDLKYDFRTQTVYDKGEDRTERDELLNMITRHLFLTEKELQTTRKQLLEATEKIHERDLELVRLKEKMSVMCGSTVDTSDSDSSERVEENSQEVVTKLKKRIHDMENFLTDYGLKWVGNDEKVPSTDIEVYTPNFVKIFKNIKDLNFIANQPKMIQTTQGAKFELPKQLSLIFYANGFMLDDGVLRSYTDLVNKVFLKDLEDGFFPSELQQLYPDGVPFDLVDQHNIFKSGGPRAFQGQGIRLGTADDTKEPKLLTRQKLRDSSNQTISAENFLKRLPTNKISSTGEIIPIRQGVEDFLKNEDHTTVKTITLLEESSSIIKSTNIITIKVKLSKDDNVVYMIKTFPKQRVDKLRSCLSNLYKERFGKICQHFSLSVYGSKPILTSAHASKVLLDCGITKNCVMIVKAV